MSQSPHHSDYNDTEFWTYSTTEYRIIHPYYYGVLVHWTPAVLPLCSSLYVSAASSQRSAGCGAVWVQTRCDGRMHVMPGRWRAVGNACGAWHASADCCPDTPPVGSAVRTDRLTIIPFSPTSRGRTGVAWKWNACIQQPSQYIHAFTTLFLTTFIPLLSIWPVSG
jgi:hypothetical protein